MVPENAVLTELQNLPKQCVARHLGSDLFARLACERVKECPFEGIEHLREEVYRLFERQGEEPRKKEEERSSPLEVGLLGAFLRHTGDPEHDLPSFAPGVRVGVGVKMRHAYRPCTRANGAGDSESKKTQMHTWHIGAKARTTTTLPPPKNSSQQWKNSWNSRYTKGKR